MSIDQLNAAAPLLTLLIIATSAVAALIQLRHSQSGNGLRAVLSLQHEFRSRAVQEALRYVQRDLRARLDDAQYRRELVELGFVDPHDHPEITACNWFDEMGTVLKNRMVTEDAFMDLFGRLVVHYWALLTPAVALMRRRRGAFQYHNFEYVAIRARAWVAKHPAGIFPRGVPRASLPDPWLEVE